MANKLSLAFAPYTLHLQCFNFRAYVKETQPNLSTDLGGTSQYFYYMANIPDRILAPSWPNLYLLIEDKSCKVF